MLSEEQRVDDAVQTGAGRNCRRFRLWGYMSRFRAGQMVLAVQIIRRDVDIPHRHLWIGMTSNFISAGKVTLERIISLAYVCLSWCGTMRVVIPAAAVTSWRQYRS